MEKLVGAVQQLSQAQRRLTPSPPIVREAARELTGADGATFVLRDGDQCYYADENAIGPLWKGKRFPIDACISGWVMRNGRPAMIEDIYGDTRISVDAYRSTFVKSLAMVPIRRDGPDRRHRQLLGDAAHPDRRRAFHAAGARRRRVGGAAKRRTLRQAARACARARRAGRRSRDGRREAPLANVLLVDDAEDYLDLAKAILFDATGLKCNLTTARDGKEALDIIRRTAGTPDEIDFILLDINMPHMDGFAFMERLQRGRGAQRSCGGDVHAARPMITTASARTRSAPPATWSSRRPGSVCSRSWKRSKACMFQHNSEGGRLLRAA